MWNHHCNVYMQNCSLSDLTTIFYGFKTDFVCTQGKLQTLSCLYFISYCKNELGDPILKLIKLMIKNYSFLGPGTRKRLIHQFMREIMNPEKCLQVWSSSPLKMSLQFTSKLQWSNFAHLKWSLLLNFGPQFVVTYLLLIISQENGTSIVEIFNSLS